MQDNLAVAFRPRLGRPTAVSFDCVTIGSAIEFENVSYQYIFITGRMREASEDAIAYAMEMARHNARQTLQRYGRFIMIDRQVAEIEDRYSDYIRERIRCRIVVVTTYHMELDRLDADRHPTFS